MAHSLHDWLRDWRELGAAAADEALHRRLLGCWSEPHRKYHTLQHLGEVLRTFDRVRAEARRPGEVALALWFHDAFYDPQRSDNEARSADWARDCVLEAGLPPERAQRVHALVMVTQGHRPDPQDADAQLLVDVDLSILGAPPDRFDESDAQVRAEYAHVPETAWREGRKRILAGFLARPRLFATAHFHNACEAQARSNLQRALQRLEG